MHAHVHLRIYVNQQSVQAQFDSLIARAAEFGPRCVIVFFHWLCCNLMQQAVPRRVLAVFFPVVADTDDNLEQVKDHHQNPVRVIGKASVIIMSHA